MRLAIDFRRGLRYWYQYQYWSIPAQKYILGIGIEIKNVVLPSTTSLFSIFFQICKVHQHNENGLQVTLTSSILAYVFPLISPHLPYDSIIYSSPLVFTVLMVTVKLF